MLAGICCDAIQQHLEMSGHSLDRGRLEEIAIVLPCSLESLCTLRQVQSEIEFCDLAIDVEYPYAQVTTQLWRMCRDVLESEHHLKQRYLIGTAFRAEFFDELFKRHVLVRKRFQRGRSHALKCLPESWIARQIGSHNERVCKESNQLFRLDTRSIGNRSSHQDVFLS